MWETSIQEQQSISSKAKNLVRCTVHSHVGIPGKDFFYSAVGS